MITEPEEPGLYRVRLYMNDDVWTIAEWRTGQKVPWRAGLSGAWFIIGITGPYPVVTFAEIGEKVEL